MCYHVIGDALRGDAALRPPASPRALPRASRPSRRCSRRKPRRTRRQPPPAPGRSRPRSRRSPSSARSAVSDARSAADRASPRRARPTIVRAAQVEPCSRVSPDYLLAHQEYSPTTQIQGVGPVPARRFGGRRRCPSVARPERSDADDGAFCSRARAGARLRRRARCARRRCWSRSPAALAPRTPPQWLTRVAAGGAAAELHRHDRLSARRPRRDVAPRPSQRRRQGIREARQPRRSGARSDPHATARSAATIRTPRSSASSRARFATRSRRCRRSSRQR